MAVALPFPEAPSACCASAKADSPYGHSSAFGDGSHCIDPNPEVSGMLW